MLELRNYQLQNAKEATEILNDLGLVYLQHEQRSGKTLTALQIAKNINAQSVLFLTKKKALVQSLKTFRILDLISQLKLPITKVCIK